eukprot:m.65674 g.65674  ORF g.65674 m.65674 type:complete len:158 (+) comp49819_c0_seq2:479-952(+)
MRVAPIWIVCVVMCVVICVVQSPQTARARARPVEVRQKARRSRQLEVTLVDEQSPPKPTDIQFGLKPAMFSRIISSDAGTDTESDTDDLPDRSLSPRLRVGTDTAETASMRDAFAPSSLLYDQPNSRPRREESSETDDVEPYLLIGADTLPKKFAKK